MTGVLDPVRLRGDFPILRERINGHPLVYLDSAATSQKPEAVLDAIVDHYRTANANVHRGVHALAERATESFERARDRVAAFVDADPRGVVFVRNTTEGLNLVARAFAEPRWGAGDRVVVTEMEHHSNFVPWQMLGDRTGVELAVAPIGDDGRLDLVALDRLLEPPTRLLAVSHVSNVLGTVNDIAQIAAMAHHRGVVVCVDGAQAVPRLPISLARLDVDFYAFSGHKMLAPTGIGVLWGRPELLESMPPFLGGGGMIEVVTAARTTWNTVPHKFEAGTPDLAGAAGLTAAVAYLEAVGMAQIQAHEAMLTHYAYEVVGDRDDVIVHGPPDGDRSGVLSFNLQGVHPHDVGTILDREGIAVRAGHHCCQPLMRRLGVAATVRASFALYNTRDEVDGLAHGLDQVRRVFGTGSG